MAWAAFQAERAINLQATSLSTDYNQAKRWLERCPIQDLERGREIIYWVYSQQPRQAAIRVGMFVKALYKWACSDGVNLLDHNPTLSVKAPKPLQKECLEIRAWSDDEAQAHHRSHAAAARHGYAVVPAGGVHAGHRAAHRRSVRPAF